MRPSKIKYAKSGDVHVAYQVVGDAPVDVVFVPWWLNHLEEAWDDPATARFLERLSSFSRLILFDQRGTGLSDAINPKAVPTLEVWMDDIRAVLDAAGSERAAVYGHGDGGLVSMLFAASHPERTSALVLSDAYARITWEDHYGMGIPRDIYESFCEVIEEGWGEGVMISLIAPSLDGDESFRERLARKERLSVSPGAAVAIQRAGADVDVRNVLSAIRVPTLVMHKSKNAYVLPEHGRYLASHIHGANYVEITGSDHFYWLGDTDRVLDEVQEFLTGASGPAVQDRVLTTVLFTDIVGSTDIAARMGDQRWRDVLDQHDLAFRRQLARFGGREIKATGDGFFACFDGPARGVRCAIAVGDAVRRLGIEIRAGLHTGECEIRGADLGGIAVHTGARVAELAGPAQVLVSRTVKDLVAGSDLEFETFGTHHLSGVPGEWQLFSVSPA